MDHQQTTLRREFPELSHYPECFKWAGSFEAFREGLPLAIEFVGRCWIYTVSTNTHFERDWAVRFSTNDNNDDPDLFIFAKDEQTLVKLKLVL